MNSTELNPSASPSSNPRRIRVAHIFITLSIGGAERHLISLLRHLDRNRFEPMVLCLGDAGSLAERVNELGVPLTALRLNSRRLWSPWTLFQIIRWFRANRIDVAHTHMYHSNCYARLAAVLARVPVRIITVHNVKDAERKRNRWLMRWLNRFTQRIIAVSHAVKESLVQAGGDPGLIQVITNGVELPPTVSPQQRKSARTALGLGETERVILMVARMIALKRHIDLLQALSAMPPEFADVRLVLVGDGPERAQLENTARTLGLGERVRFLGTRTDVEELLPAADIGVLCSEHEALGIALLENMGAGMPVVASRVGGIPEVVNNDNGILYTCGDVPGLRAALETLLRDPERRRLMGENGKRRVIQNFSADSMTRQIEQCYSQSIAKTTSLEHS